MKPGARGNYRALRPELTIIAGISKVGGGALNPDAGDLALTAGWGVGAEKRHYHAGEGQGC